MSDGLGVTHLEKHDMNNQNKRAACDHKRNPDGGWCYMFRDEPEQICGLHTIQAIATRKTHLIGGAMQQMVEDGIPLVKALDAALKVYDH